MKVLVTHPGRQHSHQAALALERAGMLAGYWAGVPALASHRGAVPAALWRRFVRYAPVPLPAERVRWFPWAPVLRRLADRLPATRLAAHADFLACRLFDRWAAARLERLARESGAQGVPDGPDVVLACEISALDTFRRARRLGIVTVLDAASTHHRIQDRRHGFAEPAALHRRITAVKDEEVALADHVLTVSGLARRSYLEAGVPPGRVHCVPLGADLALFQPPVAAGAPDGTAAGATASASQGSGPAGGAGVTFVFAGAASPVKGFDLLLDAFRRVRAEEPAARLWTIGPPGPAAQAGAPSPEGVSALGPLPQAELAARFRAADCLVLPSRNESFGMVVPEALASGLPVLVSAGAGAAELVREGANGWVVPAGYAAALAERMLWCARHPGELRAMRAACRESAAGADWSVYRERLPALLLEIFREEQASALNGAPPSRADGAGAAWPVARARAGRP